MSNLDMNKRRADGFTSQEYNFLNGCGMNFSDEPVSGGRQLMKKAAYAVGVRENRTEWTIIGTIFHDRSDGKDRVVYRVWTDYAGKSTRERIALYNKTYRDISDGLEILADYLNGKINYDEYCEKWGTWLYRTKGINNFNQ